jgi:hypothetical protein
MRALCRERPPPYGMRTIWMRCCCQLHSSGLRLRLRRAAGLRFGTVADAVAQSECEMLATRISLSISHAPHRSQSNFNLPLSSSNFFWTSARSRS